MHRHVLLFTVLFTLGAVLAGHAAPFVNPPDASGLPWAHGYPYQRNAMIEFDTDPATWPLIVSGSNFWRWDLDPTLDPPNYHLQGGDDWALVDGDPMWTADFFQVTVNNGTRSWLETDTWFGTDATGILGFESTGGTSGTADMVINLRWGLQNWPRGDEKHVWDEIIWQINDDVQVGEEWWNWRIVPPAGYETQYIPVGGGELDNGWNVTNHYGQIWPNPDWEILRLTITLPHDSQNPSRFAVDSWHAATECPEPGTIALFGLGAVGLVLWRRRKRS